MGEGAGAVEGVVMADTGCRCRLCGAGLSRTFADLRVSPLANSFVPGDGGDRMEPFYPLHVFVCTECWLVQLREFESPSGIFSNYLYFSSFSESWLRHAERYAGDMVRRFALTGDSFACEVASNDGYLLQYLKAAGVRVLGVDPARNVAESAIARGIPTEVAFFGAATATRLRAEHGPADLMTANNVLAHVPDIHDFAEGFHILLGEHGTATFEFPHLLRLIEQNQFDTIYHEHFSYLSLGVVERLFAGHGMEVYDVEEQPTHGGSLRIFVRQAAGDRAPVSDRVTAMRRVELDAGLQDVAAYDRFAAQVVGIKCEALGFLIEAKRAGAQVAAYGAPAKGNTLLNYCGIGTEFIAYTVDLNPHKQGTLLPGCRLPVRGPEAIAETKPDYLVILPWNLRDEIVGQMAAIREWGGKFVVFIPELRVF